MINLSGIHKSYRSGASDLHVLKGIDLQIDSGEMVSVMGSSGSGKSTLMNIIGLLDHADAGDYELDGKPIGRIPERKAAKLRNHTLGFIFQSFNLIPFKTAEENVALPLLYRGVGRRQRRKRALDTLELVGLREWSHHLPSQLSGGQQQRVAIARALAAEPKLILADEPTGALDSVTSAEIMKVLRRVNEQGTTMLIVTHEHDIAELTDRVIDIADGLIVTESQEAISA